MFELNGEEKCKLENLKYRDTVTYWQLPSMYYLLFENIENAQNLYHILQTLIQSLTFAKMSNLPMSVTSTFFWKSIQLFFMSVFFPDTILEAS